jgi:2-succinyl-5-enolpyruvyl-6-hydroxy-3-cyclohexene-1-carboxylate synthase
VVATTSGTAAVELHPSVVEASHAGIPLIAATADRPPELHGVGAPQTVEQDGLFGLTPRWTASPGVAELAASAGWRPLAARSVAAAVGGPGGPGPVHLNLAFREPLLGTAATAGGVIPAGRADGAPWHERSGAASGPPRPAMIERLVAHAGGRGLIVAGAGAGDPATVVAAAGALGWPLLAEPRSGCRLPGEPVIAAADALLRIPQIAAWRPDVVLRVGAPWASRVVSQWLAGLDGGVAQVLVDPWDRWADPDRRVGFVLAADPTAVAAALLAAAGSEEGGERLDSGWCRRWCDAERAAQGALDAEMEKGAALAMSEPAVARAVVAGLPAGGLLMASSSMPVRDVEWYGAPREKLTVLSNRGANGIDGVLSTAIGAALGGGVPTVALLGDLAFLYDAGALLGSGRRQLALTIVVVDNNGGGIFSFLPQAAALPEAEFERYWGTPHDVDLATVAGAYGAEVARIADRGALESLLAGAGRPGVRVGIVTSDRAANVAAHDRVHRVVERAVTSLLGRGPGPDT